MIDWIRPGLGIVVDAVEQGTRYQPTCTLHERQWFGPQTFHRELALTNAQLHRTDEHERQTS